MAAHECPTCQYQHEPPNFLAAIYALGALARAAEDAGARIRSAGATPCDISVTVETEDDLRALASWLRFPDPSGGILVKTRGVFAGISVTMHYYKGKAS